MENNARHDKGAAAGSRGWRLISLCCIAGLLCGCLAPQKKSEEKTFMEEWKQKQEESRGYSPGGDVSLSVAPETLEVAPLPPPPAAEAAAGAAEPAPAARPLPADRISMKMHNVEVAVLLRALARIAGQNIIINENVKGAASINISSAPWEQVFLGVLKTHGLTYRWEGDIIRIIGVRDLESELALMAGEHNYREKKKEHDLKMKSLGARERLVEPLKTEIVHIGYADPEVLKEKLEKFLQTGAVGTDWTVSGEDQGKVSSRVRGSILVDPHTRSLMIQAVPSDMARILPIIERLDSPTPQFFIEAHIVEATQRTARDLGIRWGGLYLNASGDAFNWVGGQPSAEGQSLYGADNAPALAQPTTASVVDTGIDAITEGGSLAYQFQKAGIGLLSVQLKALEESGEANILSSPFITTLDNQKATIESGQEIPYQTVEDNDVKIEYKEALVKLEVTPSVIDGDTLRLEVSASKDEPDFINDVGGQPTINTRKAETTVFLYDGQTTVIGGLSKKNVSDGEGGVPGLARVPLLGALFRGESNTKEFDELLIFITPHILKQRLPSPRP